MAKDVFDEEDPDAIEKQERVEAEAKETEARAAVLDLKRALEHDYVRRTLFRLMGYCDPFFSPWAPGAEMARNVGRLEVGQHILGLIGGADPRILGKMIEEAYTKKLKESIS